MARPRLPLYGKILLWFLFNLMVLAILGLLFLRAQFQLGLDWMLAGPAGERLELFAETLSAELRRAPEGDWTSILSRHEAEVGLPLVLFGSDGTQRLGAPLGAVPEEVRSKLIDKRRTEDMPPPRPSAAKPPRGPDPAPNSRTAFRDQPPKPRFMLRTANPVRYWAGVHLPLAYGTGPERRPLTLVMVSDSLSGRGFFFNPWPWVGLVAGGLLISAFIWLPLVGGITRAIRQTNEASKQIAAGHFDVRLPARSQDELGELAASVNTMAGRLGQSMAEQRRIDADIAHELCSPIARMQMALGVLEQRSVPEQTSCISTLDTELQRMARLVEEILAFSKTETLPERESPTEVDLVALIENVVDREASGADVVVDLPDELHLTTWRTAIDRALSNVVRNAVRYAAHAGPIRIQAETQSGGVILRVMDQGPGVPAEALNRLFDPFYRPEAARQRHTGGSGLGLAIAKRCVEACGGRISAELRQPSGLAMILVLPPNSAEGQP